MGLGSFLKQSVPWLATAAELVVPGAAPLIKVASSILTAKLGKTVEPTNDAVQKAITDAFGDPAQHAALLESEQAFQQAMQQMKFQHLEQMTELANADTASARAREIAVKDNTPRNLAYLVVGSSMFMCLYLVSPWSKVGTSVALAGFAGTVVGYAISEAKQVMTYYFGSSAGSDAKTEILGKIAQNGNGNGAAH